MFGVQEQQKQESEPHQIQAPTATAEEEALKRNTDCVYFLASPLTCKKGSECEYRHSDVARVNPRDCWYWLNGNCLNPKCAFRHPPLDGLLGAQAPAPVGPPLPSASAAQGPYAPGKQAVPCIFFQKGYCLKGDACPFMHAPYSANFKVAQSASATLVTETIPHKKTFGVLQKCTQEEKVIQNNVPKSAELPPPAKPANRVETAPLRNGVAANKIVPKPKFSDDELPRYKPAIIHSAGNGNSVNSKSNRNQQFLVPDDQSILNSKDADDFSREPSPGFDVLVDNELSDSEYYHNEDQFGGHEGRNLNPANDYDIGRSSDYNSMAEVDRDMYRDSRNYDSFDHRQGHYGREERRASSERVSERRRYPRADSPNRIDESDLRHHLSKQKRSFNGLRSVISRDHAHVEDRSYRAPRRDHIPAHESSVSSRLRGRIKIPGRSTSPVNNNDSWSERERHRGRLSSPERERPHGVRFGDRIKGRVQEDFNNEGRNFQGGPRIRRDIVEDDSNNVEFSGPKRLAELKTGRTSESYEQQMNDRLLLGKRKYPVQQDDGDIAFEGPKPLSEILKRKRGEVHNNPKEVKESLPTKEESKPEQNVKSTEGQTSLQNNNVSEVEIGEEGAIGEAAMEDHGLEAYDKREGESEFYEQADGEEYNLEEGENVDLEEEYFEEDDDADDFAKKMGVMYS